MRRENWWLQVGSFSFVQNTSAFTISHFVVKHSHNRDRLIDFLAEQKHFFSVQGDSVITLVPLHSALLLQVTTFLMGPN